MHTHKTHTSYNTTQPHNTALGRAKAARKDFRAVCKLRPKDRDARTRLSECDKAVREAVMGWPVHIHAITHDRRTHLLGCGLSSRVTEEMLLLAQEAQLLTSWGAPC